MDKLREKFQATFSNWDFDMLENGDYIDPIEYFAWQAYQAAYAQAISEFEQVGKAINEDSYGLTIHFPNGYPDAGTPLYTRKD